MADPAPQLQASWGSGMVAADVDGDGRTDLLIAAPRWDVSPAVEDAGRVWTLLGTPYGLGAPRSPIGYGGGDAFFGAALAVGDFDGGGGLAWLAVGVPFDDFGTTDTGIVRIAQWNGSTWENRDFFASGYEGVPGGNGAGDAFGSPLAVGDFDGNGFDDLAIGAPGKTYRQNATTEWIGNGAVYVLYGGPTGLTDDFPDFFQPQTGGVVGAAQDGAAFGSALVVGDFDGDGFDDLAIGAPDRDVTVSTVTYVDAGEVVVLYGSASGLTTSGGLRLTDADLGGAVEAGDRFGAALATGNFRLAFLCFGVVVCYDGLAIGAPGENDGSGRVHVVHGSASGLDPTDRQAFVQSDVDAVSSPETGDGFGAVLVAGQLDARLGTDLAIGAPGEDVFSTFDQGLVSLVYGGASGLLSYPGQSFYSTAPLASAPGAAGDRYGAALAIGGFGRGGETDLAIGLPGRAVSGLAGAGLVELIYGGDGWIFGDGFEGGNAAAWSAKVP